MFVLRAQSFAGATCASASPAVSLWQLSAIFGVQLLDECLPVSCSLLGSPEQFPPKNPDSPSRWCGEFSACVIKWFHHSPSGVLAEMPGKWEHVLLCQSEILKSVLRLSVLPASASLWGWLHVPARLAQKFSEFLEH